ncbi:hypothetical protein [Sulfuriroseicoccus oceanibius]|uniref:Uncharacterized protein n=1 Tax=Sulfuriroseicoccus oceanibius TaxID=2707525 RepID=A0A6B3LC31_9BACT|nr:hypothetical protein [Sulfuriroseicoccus oceanibius]QQL45674.1 hypothetical protein G3M56_003540 [Sulfuriroseicoccus oceanibius]
MSSDYDDPWTISDEQKMRFAALFLLEYVINKPMLFKVWLDRDDSDLEPVLEWMLVQKWIEIRDGDHYVPTERGREVLETFIKRYAEYVYFFDVFCAVDLGEGSFAFERFFDFDSEEEWHRYLDQERFEDLRIAVAEYLDLDAVELVFMQFVREERFGRDATGWQFDLLLGAIWDEILEICNEALDVNDLGYEDDQGVVDGEVVIEDVIGQGGALLGQLLARADRALKGISDSSGGAADRVVPPVEFPPASRFDFDQFARGEKKDDLWDEISKL